MGVVNAQFSQGSRPDFWCSQGVKHENLLGQDLDHGHGWKYRRLCSVPPLEKLGGPGDEDMLHVQVSFPKYLFTPPPNT